MPAPSCRMKPARTSSLWLATCASAGASLRVGTNAFESRTGRMVRRVIPRGRGRAYCGAASPRRPAGGSSRLRRPPGRDVERLGDDGVLELLGPHPLHDPAVAEQEPDAPVAVGDA